jgi:hypothetical protein
MKSDSQLIFERYAQSKQQFILEGSIKDLYNYDMQCVYELMQEGMFSDTLSKFGQSVKGAASKVGSFVKGKLEQSFGALLAKMLPEEEKAKLQSQLQDLQKDPSKLEEYKKQGMAELNKSSEASEEFAFESNKSFLVRTVFTQDNLEELFESFLLEEAARKKKARLKPTVKSTAPSAAQIADFLKKKYKNPQSLQKGYDAFNNQLTKKLGVQPTSVKSASRATGSRATGSKASASAPIATVDTEEVPNPEKEPLGREPISTLPQRPVDTGSAVSTSSAAPQQKEGLFKKAFDWVKKNPNLTAAGVIGIVAALTVVSGGSLLPVLAGALKGGAIAGGIDAAKQKLQTGKVDWKKTGSSALKGAAGGSVLGGVLGGGSGGEDVDTTDTDTGASASDEGIVSGGGDFDSDVESGEFRDGIDSDSDPDETTGDEPEYNTPASEELVSNDEFKRFNKSNFDIKSKLDQKKMDIMRNLKQQFGTVSPSKYNAALKAAGLVKESYTKGYIRFF